MTTPTKYESAKLILELYDLRREEKMRISRDWWWSFNPKTAEDFGKAAMSADSAKLRQSIGYWEMAASLVNHGAIDEAMFTETNGEYLFMFAKVQPFLADLRAQDPRAFVNIEKLIKRQPNWEQQLEGIKAMIAKWTK